MGILDNWHEPQSTKYGTTKIAIDTPIRTSRADKDYYMFKIRRFDGGKEKVAELLVSESEAKEIYRALHLLLMKPR
jgi:hypothetical protein